MIAARRSRTSGSISRRARSSRPAATRAIAVASVSPSSGVSCEPVAYRALGQATERHELAARANRLRDRPELVGDEHDRRVERRLLEILQECVGRLGVEQMCVEDQVDAASASNGRRWRSWWRSRISSMRIISPSGSITRRSGWVLSAARASRPRAVRSPTPSRRWSSPRRAARGRGRHAHHRRRARRAAAASPRLARGPFANGSRAVTERSAPAGAAAISSASSPAGRVPSSTTYRSRIAQRAAGTRRRRGRGIHRPRARSGHGLPLSAPTASSGPISSRIVRSGSRPSTAARLRSSTRSSPRPRAIP